jgi:uncharacterized damage-inducible protein DinB
MREMLRLQAEANRFINRRWLEVLGDASFAALDEPRGAFFGSIFGTFNHILLGDRIWLGRIQGRPFEYKTLADRLCADLGSLRSERERTDTDLIAMLAARPDVTEPIAYRDSKGKPYAQPLWEILLHVFAHQHHHRGQISQMCHELGIPIPDGGLIGYYRARSG